MKFKRVRLYKLFGCADCTQKCVFNSLIAPKSINDDEDSMYSTLHGKEPYKCNNFERTVAEWIQWSILRKIPLGGLGLLEQ